jgi:hypothetical protein
MPQETDVIELSGRLRVKRSKPSTPCEVVSIVSDVFVEVELDPGIPLLFPDGDD